MKTKAAKKAISTSSPCPLTLLSLTHPSEVLLLYNNHHPLPTSALFPQLQQRANFFHEARPTSQLKYDLLVLPADLLLHVTHEQQHLVAECCSLLQLSTNSTQVNLEAEAGTFRSQCENMVGSLRQIASCRMVHGCQGSAYYFSKANCLSHLVSGLATNPRVRSNKCRWLCISNCGQSKSEHHTEGNVDVRIGSNP